MSSLHYYLRLMRLQHVLMGALASFLVAKVLYTDNGIIYLFPLIISLQIMGASIYYYAAANKMYRNKKQFYGNKKETRFFLLFLGLLFMLGASFLAYIFLNQYSFLVTVFNVLVIILYRDIISKWWPSKNILMAVVCTSPIFLVWCSSESINYTLSRASVVVFLAYLCREIVKDIGDMDIDRGHRKTLALQDGAGVARVIAGTAILFSCLFLLQFILSLTNIYSMLAGFLTGLYFIHSMLQLLFAEKIDENKISKKIIFGIAYLMLSFALLLI